MSSSSAKESMKGGMETRLQNNILKAMILEREGWEGKRVEWEDKRERWREVEREKERISANYNIQGFYCKPRTSQSRWIKESQ
jgi:hypothetical protein